MVGFQIGGEGKASKILSLWIFCKRYWYWILLICFLLPSLLGTIRSAYSSGDYASPFVMFATSIFSADQVLEYKVDLLSEGNLTAVVGVEKPSGEGSHIWRSVVWGWSWFWAVPYAIVGLIWVIFFPAVVIYKLVRMRRADEIYKNLGLTALYFFLYLFIVNVGVLIYGLASGSPLLSIPEGANTSKSLLIGLLELVPFHGIGKLVIYIVRWILGIAPPFF